ncbi:chemotaxis protein CheA [candidate division KSB1 bacterium]|nr:chemotaxis protein CheA [candidate division KSB1 bacterium]
MESINLSSGCVEGCQQVRAMIERYAAAADQPAALRELAQQAGALLDDSAWTADQSEASLKKLGDLLDAMRAAESNAPPAAQEVVDDALVMEFLNDQDSVLQDFEEKCLALENGDRDVLPAIKRQLHTWKGDAGLLGFIDLSRLMHQVEDLIPQTQGLPPSLIADALLKIKDQLAAYFTAKKSGQTATLQCELPLGLLSLNATQPEQPPLPPPTPVVASVPTPPPATASVAPPDSYALPAEIDMDVFHDFLAESVEHFQNAEVALMSLEGAPDNLEAVNTVFRAFHTIKGVSSFIGISVVTELAHKAETYLDRVRKGQLVLEGGLIDLAFEACDTLKALVNQLHEALANGAITVPPNYHELLRKLENPERVAATARTEPRLGEIMMAQGAVAPEAVADALKQQDSGDHRPLGEILVDQQAAKPADVNIALRTQAAAPAKSAETDGSVKVNTSRLDNLINMVGELVIAQAMVNQDVFAQNAADQRLVRNVSQLGKITRSLQELALTMRMVSVKPLFQKMARLVRDVSRKANKEVAFETFGDETELDRNVVEAIADPLVHMVRNAVDHGIEKPDDRPALGKTRAGRVTLSAAHEGGSVVITLTDDGRGLNAEKILKKAVDLGLVEPGAQLSQAEMLKLIFMPGFSTAEKVSDVSGRGVGMDVVRTNIEALRGSVELASTPGQGCRFRIRLPLTLAIIDGMVVRAGSERFIIPTVGITESLRPQPKDISTVQGRAELINLRGDLLPVCRLHRLFNIPDAIQDLREGILVVIESKSKRCALLVDELVDQQQVVVKGLGNLFADVRCISGGAILGDGRISLIVDVDGLIHAFAD